MDFTRDKLKLVKVRLIQVRMAHQLFPKFPMINLYEILKHLHIANFNYLVVRESFVDEIAIFSPSDVNHPEIRISCTKRIVFVKERFFVIYVLCNGAEFNGEFC